MTTVRSEFWGSGYALQGDKASTRTILERALRRKGMRKINELLATLIGVAAGQAALKQHSRVTGVAQVGDIGSGGQVPVEVVDDVNRVSAAADVTDLNLLLTTATAPTYVADASGNGGGAFTPGS